MALRISKTKLNGSVKISGAKNSSLRLLAASLLTEDLITLHNFPNGLLDVQIHLEMLKVLGKKIDTHDDVISIQGGNIKTTLNWEERSIRNTLLILGALTARYGEGKVPLP